MRWSRDLGRAAIPAALAALLGAPAPAPGQAVEEPAPRTAADAPKSGTTGETLGSITDDYERQLLELDRRRLDRLAALAARQAPGDAAETYERLFRLAIAGNLFREAEAPAKAVVGGGSPSPTVLALAEIVKIIAEADRGAYDESLATLRQALAAGQNPDRRDARATRPSTDELVGICDAYYQRLVQAGRYETARKALRLVLGQTDRPVLKEFLSGRLKRIDAVGKPAPAIRGVDLDGKPFDLADARGKVVLVEFWASWSLPSAAEVDAVRQMAESYRGRGLRVVGICLDTAEDGGRKLDSVMPGIRRFVLDHNISWPTLVNGTGDRDYAAAFGVTEIPANVLIGKDGTVTQIDLVRKTMGPVLDRALGGE